MKIIYLSYPSYLGKQTLTFYLYHLAYAKVKERNKVTITTSKISRQTFEILSGNSSTQNFSDLDPKD